MLFSFYKQTLINVFHEKIKMSIIVNILYKNRKIKRFAPNGSGIRLYSWLKNLLLSPNAYNDFLQVLSNYDDSDYDDVEGDQFTKSKNESLKELDEFCPFNSQYKIPPKWFENFYVVDFDKQVIEVANYRLKFDKVKKMSEEDFLNRGNVALDDYYRREFMEKPESEEESENEIDGKTLCHECQKKDLALANMVKRLNDKKRKIELLNDKISALEAGVFDEY